MKYLVILRSSAISLYICGVVVVVVVVTTAGNVNVRTVSSMSELASDDNESLRWTIEEVTSLPIVGNDVDL